jgi:hypothetical protein
MEDNRRSPPLSASSSNPSMSILTSEGLGKGRRLKLCSTSTWSRDLLNRWSRRKDRLIAVTSATNDAELDVPCRDPPRLVFGEQLGCRAPAGLISEIDT